MEKSDSSTSMIASVQMLNYQNLITNAQNQIKDLELQKEVLETGKTFTKEELKKSFCSGCFIRFFV